MEQVLCLCLVGLVAGQQARTFLETSTPVPILRFIDRQNTDGSYTYGFESGDGTYKIETRLVDGQVKGKYGYFDPEGEFRETTYGATNENGFQPKIKGVLLPPPTQSAVDDIRQNEIQLQEISKPVLNQRKFSNFVSRKPQEPRRTQDDVRMINGRRAVLKRRLVKKPVAENSQQERLTTRQRQLEELRQQRRQLQKLQQQQQQLQQQSQREVERNQHQRSFPSKESSFRSFLPQAQDSQYKEAGPVDPYVTHGSDFGSYTITY